MKKVFLPICFLSMIIFSGCYSSPPVPVTTTPSLDWSIYYRYEPTEDFWQVGQNRYQIISDCSSVSYLPSVKGRQVGFVVDENLTLYQDGVVELEFNRIWLRYDGMTYIGSFNPKQPAEIIFGYDKLSFDQATEAADKCNVRVIVNDNLTFKLSPMEPTQERNAGTYYAEP